MVRKNAKVPLTSKVLHELITKDNSCVEMVKQERDISTLPYHGNKISNAIKEQLNELISKFVKELNGIVLAYKNIKVLSDVGLIDDSGCLNFSILADFFVFKPVPGRELPGVVFEKNQELVGCLVYHTFTVSIAKPEGETKWAGDDVEIGQEIIFRVTSVDLNSRIPYIQGEFLQKTRVNRKIKFDDIDESVRETEEECPDEKDSKDREETFEDKPVKKKKKKSRRSFENEIDEVELDTSKLQRKSKKRKTE